MVPHHSSDLDLITLIQQGNRKAFEVLFKKYWPQLLDVAFKRLQSEELAQEVVQELFIDLWCKRAQLHVTHSVPAYLHTALKYKTLNQLRSASIQHKYLDKFRNICQQFANPVEESVFFHDLNQSYEQQIDQLPPQCKTVFLLSRKENRTFPEIAEQLNISINTVEKHMGKALKLIRTHLKDHLAELLILLTTLFK